LWLVIERFARRDVKRAEQGSELAVDGHQAWRRGAAA
jgi:hypothetical protein